MTALTFILALGFFFQAHSLELSRDIELLPGVVADFDVAADGTIFVSNLGTHTVDVYSPSGEHLRSIRLPVEEADFFRPGAIASEAGDRFWVVDGFSGRVMRYIADGNLLSAFSLEADGTKLSAVVALAVLPPREAPKIESVAGGVEAYSPEESLVAGSSEAGASLPESGLALIEGRLFLQRPDGVISVFDLFGGWVYDLDPPETGAIRTPAGVYLDYPLLWSLDYESRVVSIYDLDRRGAQPGRVGTTEIPDTLPISGLTGVDGGTLLVVTSGKSPVWEEGDETWIPVLERVTDGSQPPIARVSGSTIYLLDRDSQVIEIYSWGGRPLPPSNGAHGGTPHNKEAEDAD